jgi:circadian clock protein KaiC
LGVSQISKDIKASAIVDNIILLSYVEISTLLRRALTVPKSRGSKPTQRTKEYLIESGGINILDDQSVENVPAVPQLPLSSYYGVLARSPTRTSPVIDETLASGSALPLSQMPSAGAQRKKTAKSKK